MDEGSDTAILVFPVTRGLSKLHVLGARAHLPDGRSRSRVSQLRGDLLLVDWDGFEEACLFVVLRKCCLAVPCCMATAISPQCLWLGRCQGGQRHRSIGLDISVADISGHASPERRVFLTKIDQVSTLLNNRSAGFGLVPPDVRLDFSV